jgi:hypothetical protein
VAAKKVDLGFNQSKEITRTMKTLLQSWKMRRSGNSVTPTEAEISLDKRPHLQSAAGMGISRPGNLPCRHPNASKQSEHGIVLVSILFGSPAPTMSSNSPDTPTQRIGINYLASSECREPVSKFLFPHNRLNSKAPNLIRDREIPSQDTDSLQANLKTTAYS